MSNYITKGAPWAIGINVSDCHTSREVMEKAKLNFTVDKCELVAKMSFGKDKNNIVNDLAGDFAKDGYIYREVPNAYGTFRADTCQPLGIVTDRYEVVQNIDAFKFFDDAIGDGVRWDKAGCLNGGERIFVSAKLSIRNTVAGDPVDDYLVFTNSHDGSCSINIMFTPIRVYCTNMLSGALKKADAYIKIKHTQSAKHKLNLGADILRAAIQCSNTANELYNALYKIRLTDKDVLNYLCNLVLSSEEHTKLLTYDKENGYNKLLKKDYSTIEATNISTRKINKVTSMFKYYCDGIAQKEIRGTAWGAYNAITGFYSNIEKMSGERRTESLLYGGASNTINVALQYASKLHYNSECLVY